MAKKKYYAVKKGRVPGIYESWEDCKRQIDHFSGAEYKGFEEKAQAEQFLSRTSGMEESKKLVSDEACLVAYVDGSFDNEQKRYGYGCVFVLPEEIKTINGSGNDAEYVSMRNVAGEILGSEKAVLWALEHGYEKIIIYYDYEGIEKWADDIWKANKPGTQRYKEFIARKREQIKIYFQKVAAHTGDTYNEMADKLAKNALGL